MQTTDILDHRTADVVTEIWGFNKIPNLPLTPEQVLGDYKKLGIFGPSGSVRVNISAFPPADGQSPDLGSLMSKIDFGTGGGMTPHPGGPGMHRTDTIDLAVILKGEIDLAYPAEDGQVQVITATEGDVIVQNGAFHEWRNHSSDYCVVLFVVFGTDRASSSAS